MAKKKWSGLHINEHLFGPSGTFGWIEYCRGGGSIRVEETLDRQRLSRRRRVLRLRSSKKKKGEKTREGEALLDMNMRKERKNEGGLVFSSRNVGGGGAAGSEEEREGQGGVPQSRPSSVRLIQVGEILMKVKGLSGNALFKVKGGRNFQIPGAEKKAMGVGENERSLDLEKKGEDRKRNNK